LERNVSGYGKTAWAVLLAYFLSLLWLLYSIASLLPSSDRRSVKTPPRKSISGSSAGRLFSRTKLIALVGHQFNDEHDKISIYSDLGVELLHILKYTCVNAAGIRKISKKYAKLINFFPVAQEADSAKAKEDNELLMPKEVAQRYETIADSRIDQITNNKDFATVRKQVTHPIFT
jgi:hypothetical protein